MREIFTVSSSRPDAEYRGGISRGRAIGQAAVVRRGSLHRWPGPHGRIPDLDWPAMADPSCLDSHTAPAAVRRTEAAEVAALACRGTAIRARDPPPEESTGWRTAACTRVDACHCFGELDRHHEQAVGELTARKALTASITWATILGEQRSRSSMNTTSGCCSVATRSSTDRTSLWTNWRNPSSRSVRRFRDSQWHGSTGVDRFEFHRVAPPYQASQHVTGVLPAQHKVLQKRSGHCKSATNTENGTRHRSVSRCEQQSTDRDRGHPQERGHGNETVKQDAIDNRRTASRSTRRRLILSQRSRAGHGPFSR